MQKNKTKNNVEFFVPSTNLTELMLVIERHLCAKFGARRKKMPNSAQNSGLSAGLELKLGNNCVYTAQSGAR